MLGQGPGLSGLASPTVVSMIMIFVLIARGMFSTGSVRGRSGAASI